MIYLNETKTCYNRSLRGSVWRRRPRRTRQNKRWMRRNEPFTRGVSVYRRTPPSIYTPGVRKVPIVAYGRMWRYEDKPILFKRKSLRFFLRNEGGVRRWEVDHNYWVKQKEPRRNLLQKFMRNVVHYFEKPIVGDVKKMRKLKRHAFFARQDFWYESLHGKRGAKHRIQVIDWPTFGFGLLDGIMYPFSRELHEDYSNQCLTEEGRDMLETLVVPRMKACFKWIRKGRLSFARYWLRPGSRLLRARRDIPRGNWEPSEELIKSKMERYVRRRTEEHFYDRPWHSRQTLIQYIENYPERMPFYSALDTYPVGGWRLQTSLGGDQFIHYWDGTVLDRRLPTPSSDLYPFDLDVTHNYGLDVLGGRSRLQKRQDREFKRMSTRRLVGFVIEELFMDSLEDDYSDQLWEDSEKMYCQDEEGEWIIDDDEGAGYDVDDETECDLMYRHMVIGVAIRRFYKNGMRWIRLPYRKQSFLVILQVAYILYLFFLTSTFIFFLYLSDSFVNLTIFIILALIAMFW